MEIHPNRTCSTLFSADFGTRLHDSKTENNFELGGISIGVAMNSVDYYANGDRDAETEISKEVMIEQAKTIVNQILTRLRQMMR